MLESIFYGQNFPLTKHIFKYSVTSWTVWSAEQSQEEVEFILQQLNLKLCQIFNFTYPGHVPAATSQASLPQWHSQLRGDLKTSPDHRGYMYTIHHVGFSSARGSPPCGTCTENLQGEVIRRRSNLIRCSNHHRWPLLMRRSSGGSTELPLEDGAPHLISQAEPGHPTEEARFSHLRS